MENDDDKMKFRSCVGFLFFITSTHIYAEGCNTSPGSDPNTNRIMRGIFCCCCCRVVCRLTVASGPSYCAEVSIFRTNVCVWVLRRRTPFRIAENYPQLSRHFDLFICRALRTIAQCIYRVCVCVYFAIRLCMHFVYTIDAEAIISLVAFRAQLITLHLKDRIFYSSHSTASRSAA